MDFNKEFSDFKNRESDQLAKFGEGARIYRILGEIEMKRGFAKYFYEAGQQSKQAEIDALKCELAKHQREGYKLVPVEPSNEILSNIEARCFEHPDCFGIDCPLDVIYRAIVGEME